MPYRVDLGAGQQVYIEQMGTDTAVVVANSGPGQQQQSSSRFATGQWTKEPRVYLLDEGRSGIVIKVVAIQGQCFIQVYQGQISVQTTPGGELQEIRMAYVDETPGIKTPPMRPMKPMEPMEPMESMPPMEPMPPMQMGQPMEMGNMSMNADTMEMHMGNMHMGGADNQPRESGGKRFCTQCGEPVQPVDKFCGSCGHKLS